MNEWTIWREHWEESSQESADMAVCGARMLATGWDDAEVGKNTLTYETQAVRDDMKRRIAALLENSSAG